MRNTDRKYSVRGNYESKIQRLIGMLKTDEQHSVVELAEIFDVSRRSVYNMIDEVSSRGFHVVSNNGIPRLRNFIDQVSDTGDVFLTQNEADLLLYLINHLAQGNPQRQSLTSLMGRDLRDLLQPYFSNIDADLAKVSRIGQALRSHHQLMLRRYRSGSSGTIADRRVEPVQWSPTYHQLYAFDVDKRSMRAFVVSRMDDVEVLDQTWQHAAEHRVPDTDCFWMTGEPYEVTLRLTLRALNLLHDEYPLSRQAEVRESGDDAYPYETTLTVRSPKGVGRFALGLPDDVLLIENK